MTNIITIAGEEILPGQEKTIMLSMPRLYDWTPLAMPVHVIRGKLDGPTVCLTAAVHGDELNGTEIIRRILKKKLKKNLKGTIIAIPVVNIYGFLNQDRYLMDRRDLNRSFPGSKKGSLASRLAHLISTEIISKSNYCIDLHTGSLHRSNFPQIRADMDNPIVKELADAFNVPVALHAKLRDGSMRQHADDKHIPFLLYEAGESLRLDELCIKTGVNGILGVLNKIGMLEGKMPAIKTITTSYSRTSSWVRAQCSGIFRPCKKLGGHVKKGELLAYIGNPTDTVENKLFSPINGIIIGKNNLPMVHEGAALFNIAEFTQLAKVEAQIEVMKDSHGPV